MKKILCSLFLLVSAITLKAQTKLSIEAGLLSSGYTGKSGGKMIYTADKWGGRFGVGFDSKVSKRIYMQTGLLYVMNGYLQNTTKGDLNWSVNTLEIPLNVVYKTDRLGGDRIFVSAGPYFGVNLSGTKKYSPFDSTSYTQTLNAGNDPRDDIKYFDMGLGANVGYEFKKGLFVRLHYQVGLANLNQVGDENNKLKNKNQGISIGYLLGSNKAKRDDRKMRAFRNHGLEM